MDRKLKRRSILTSLLIGTPTGLLTALIFFELPIMITGEGLATMGMLAMVGAFDSKTLIVLLISFLVGLWYGGANVYSDFSKNKKLLLVSFRYSLIVNAIIWTTSIFIHLFTFIRIGIHKGNFDISDLLFFIPFPIFAFIGCSILTTFTVGLLICYTIQRQIQQTTKNLHDGQ